MTPLIVKKVRRLRMRIRATDQTAAGQDETGVTARLGRRPGPAVVSAGRARPARRKRNTPVVSGEAAAAGGVATDPIERLVAEARERVLLMARKKATGLAQATVLGRLSATGEISRRQFEAGRRYAEIVREHDALLGAATSVGATADGMEDAAARTAYRMAMARYDGCRAALREAGREDRMASAVVDAVAVNDWELPELTPSLRIGLNHLARALDAMGGEAPGATGWFAALSGSCP